MVKRDICPGAGKLVDLIEGKLVGAQETDVSRHIESCETCQRAVEQLAPAREELLPLRVNGAELQLETREHALKQAMDRLWADASPGIEPECHAMSDDDALRILSPSDKAGSLGRLGPYEITDIIGRGGMGAVFKAIDTTLDRIVAVKVLSSSLASNGTARKRFVREARSAAAVVHDHVITIHAVDETGGQPYLVMQFVSGQSLQEKIDRSGPLEVKEILRIAKQIASGLTAAHEQGLVHRDIKPSNILLENGVERVKITDFGLARAVDDASITHSQVIAGTPQYMSPEQANGEAVDHRADLFSLGSVMYTMCTGRPPFRAESTVATLRSVSDKRPRPIREINPDIPEWLVEIIDRLHEKDSAKRFQSAAEVERLLAEQLVHLQQPNAIAASPADVAKERPPERGRPRLKLGLVAGLLAILLAVSITELTGATKIIQSLATVFRIETPKGTVVVEVDDPNATVTLDGEEIVVGADGFKELRLKPGSYEFGTKRNGVRGKTYRVAVTQGSREIVKISFEKRPTEKGVEKPKGKSPEESNKAQEHLEVLRQRVKVLEQRYRVGEVTMDSLLRAQIDVLEAELELSTSAGERIKIREKQVAVLKDLEAVMTTLFKAGKCGHEDVLAVRADRVQAEAKLKSEYVYTCSMHPQVRRSGSGKCPICGMTLLPADQVDHDSKLPKEGTALPSPAAARPDVLRTVGTVSYDERHIAHIRARLSARVEQVYVDYVGVEVKKGDALVELYSEKLYSAEGEFLQARKSQQQRPPGETPGVDLVATARERLSLLGLTKEQIAELEKQDKPTGRLTLCAPARGVVTEIHAEKGARVENGGRLLTIADPTRLWIQLDAREADLEWLRPLQRVTLATDAHPGATFDGRIAFIGPILSDRKTRTVQVRVDFANPDRKLIPGMFVRGDVHVAETERAEGNAAAAPAARRAEPAETPLWNEFGVTPAPVSPLTARVLEWTGLHLCPITKERFRDKNVFAKYPGGLDVTFVRTHGPAEKAGIHEVDIVVGLQGRPIVSLENLDSAMQDAIEQIGRRDADSLQFYVLRSGETVRVNVSFPVHELDLRKHPDRGRGNSANAEAKPDVLRLEGTVGYDERHMVSIHTRIPARIDRLHVDHVGVEVKKGDALVELYSATLYSAEEEFLQTRKHQQQRPPAEAAGIDLLATAREKLSLLGITKDQIAELEKQNKATGRLTLHAPEGGVITEKHAEEGARVERDTRLFTIADPTRLWITLDASESDLRWLRFDQPITLTADALPGETFVSQIAFIAPQMDPKTRTVEIRVDLSNVSRKLKPGMSIRGVVDLPKD